jgi:Cohesin domain
MKKLLLLVTIFQIIVTFSYAQNIKLKLSGDVNGTGDTIKLNNHGTTLKKGDTLVLYVAANGNGNTTTRQLYFDFEYQNTALTLLSIANTGTAGNGGILPQGSSISESFYQYPGYRFTQTSSNTTSNGSANYQYANYSYTSGGNHTIIRHSLNWATTQGMPYNNYWGLEKLTFRLNATAVGLSFDPIRMNFGAAFNSNGTLGATTQEAPLSVPFYLDPNSESYVKAHVDVNPAVTQFTLARVAFIDTLTKSTYLVDANDNGDLAINQTKFKANTVYQVAVRVNADVVKDIMNAAVTVSDFTAAEAEFTNQNLDGTFTGSNIKTGIGYLSADVNKNYVFDGGDVTRIFAQSVGVDSLYVLPTIYRPGADIYLDVPTFTDSLFNNLSISDWPKVKDGYVYFKTGKLGSNLPLNLKYVIPGDINRSHSSQVVASDGTIQSFSTKYVNTPNINKSPVDVSLNNVTVTSGNIEVPISINSTNNVGALQFEFYYDTTKIKFESLTTSLPNTWYTFATPSSGKIKFGSINKGLKEPITGTQVPFILKFSSIGNALDLATQIKVGATMDASDNKGNQLGINLNTTTIKLTGYNNF